MFDKLDAYDLVANLVPGAALTYAFHASGIPAPKPDDLGAFVLVAFVIGVTVNRVGSLVLDPVMRAAGWLKPKDYRSFVTSEKDDKKLETIVANAGLYRTFLTSGCFYLLALFLRPYLEDLNHDFLVATIVVLAMIVFFFAFRKEDGYIHTRISASAPEVTLEASDAQSEATCISQPASTAPSAPHSYPLVASAAHAK